ncbi:unnamed protein product [Dimorphilus gyrociliatus]|uniref:Glycosyltransferase 61 catalytic domain-containing protein n=1 Tax=Dimorphilus gyrociliatus TaxID=2664684 RepID=A0A7I8VNA8_9ANNE|nr:unnamed protein product [Dimorphilus gyrociliatus]
MFKVRSSHTVAICISFVICSLYIYNKLLNSLEEPIKSHTILLQRIIENQMTFQNRIDDLIDFCEDELMRIKQFEYNNFSYWTNYVINSTEETYFQWISGRDSIATIVVWRNQVNFTLRSDYYNYISNNCDILTNDIYGGTFGVDNYNLTCFTNEFSAFKNKKTLSNSVFKIGLPQNSVKYLRRVWNRSDNDFPLSYIHIAHNAFVNIDGDVWKDDYKILTQRCFQSGHNLRIPLLTYFFFARSYDRVFVLTQKSSDAYFHFTVENLPRLMPYYKWLLKKESIKILLAKPKYEKYFQEVVSALKIPKSRIIHDEYIKARILYYPAGGTCGRSPIYGTQLLANYFNNSNNQENKTRIIILMKRSSPTRQWLRHKYILQMVERIAKEHLLEVMEFSDNPAPSFTETVEYFSRAKLILGPHGAGLSNIIWASKDAIIIEGLCKITPQQSNLCYRNLAAVLGLRWYGISDGCLNLKEEVLEPIIRESLKFT